MPSLSPPHSAGGARPTFLHIRPESWQAVPGPVPGIRLTRAPGTAGPSQRQGQVGTEVPAVLRELPRGLALNILRHLLGLPPDKLSRDEVRSPRLSGPASSGWYLLSTSPCTETSVPQTGGWEESLVPASRCRQPADPLAGSPVRGIAYCPLPGHSVACLTQDSLLSRLLRPISRRAPGGAHHSPNSHQSLPGLRIKSSPEEDDTGRAAGLTSGLSPPPHPSAHWLPLSCSDPRVGASLNPTQPGTWVYFFILPQTTLNFLHAASRPRPCAGPGHHHLLLSDDGNFPASVRHSCAPAPSTSLGLKRSL